MLQNFKIHIDQKSILHTIINSWRWIKYTIREKNTWIHITLSFHTSTPPNNPHHTHTHYCFQHKSVNPNIQSQNREIWHNKNNKSTHKYLDQKEDHLEVMWSASNSNTPKSEKQENWFGMHGHKPGGEKKIVE